MLRRWDDSQKYLSDNVHLVCEETANYLVIWCIDLEVEEVSGAHPSGWGKALLSVRYLVTLCLFSPLAEMCTHGAGSPPDHCHAVHPRAGQEPKGGPPCLLPAVLHEDQGQGLSDQGKAGVVLLREPACSHLGEADLGPLRLKPL